MIVLDGKKLSTNIKSELAEQVEAIKAQNGKIPHLAAVIVGNNPASEVYVRNKIKACEQVGFGSSNIILPESTTEAELLEVVKKLNNDPNVDGFIVQLPLPKHINEEKIVLAIDHRKDVDGFHPTNFGRMAQGMPAFLPATPYGVLEMLRRYKIPTSGKRCIVIGRSNIVGTPLSILLSRKGFDCTVTLAHSRTKDLKKEAKRADIIVAAIGIPHFVTADMVKKGAVVIDVGINRIEDATAASGGRLVGDVDYANVSPKCKAITPVPGGVGLMTVAALLLNTMKAAKGEIYQK